MSKKFKTSFKYIKLIIILVFINNKNFLNISKYFIIQNLNYSLSFESLMSLDWDKGLKNGFTRPKFFDDQTLFL
jgi:hypothetical protein